MVSATADSDLNDVIRTSDVIVHEGRYAYIKALSLPEGDHFLISRDEDEITVVTAEENMSLVQYKEKVDWFKLVEIRVSKPFIAKGFLAKITKTVADQDLNVLVVSTFSKDYILVKEETYKIALKALEKEGFPVFERGCG